MDMLPTPVFLGFPGGSDGKESACNAGDLGLNSGLGRSSGGGHGNPLQYSSLQNPHGQRSLVGYSPCGHKKLDMTEWLSTHRIRGLSSRHSALTVLEDRKSKIRAPAQWRSSFLMWTQLPSHSPGQQEAQTPSWGPQPHDHISTWLPPKGPISKYHHTGGCSSKLGILEGHNHLVPNRVRHLTNWTSLSGQNSSCGNDYYFFFYSIFKRTSD